MRPRDAVRRWIGRFASERSGVAAVEFALILPIMLLLYIGMMEGSTLIAMDRKVQSVSGAVGDLVSRSDGEIAQSTLEDYVRVAGGMMTPYPVAPLEQIVSQVYVDSNGTAKVDWSKRFVDQTLVSTGQHPVGATYTLPADVVSISKGLYVIVAESQYSYPPLYGIVFKDKVTLYRQNFFIPRFREKIALK
ncbi:TadE/TadG family type IV pilus assembly protein [Devosia sp. FKR38]|uniref:TadE/TadG family type IV pilus assembly protein n=1 Tax=Devosia sp. FKR38 TaxID=2562312 RepID=UPI001484F06A|nr:TadE/TadG family type IV pilus assembly protein [Devosia sp. FKR38]